MAIFPMGNNEIVSNLGCDTENDISALLPVYSKSNNIKPGSTCYVVENSKLYMMNSLGEWIKQN